MRVFRIIIKILAFIPFGLIMYPVRIIGKGNLPKGNYLVLSNHLHWLDILVLWYHLPRFKYFLAKKELAKKRFNRFVLWLFAAKFIDRHKPDLKGIREAVAALKDAPMIVFPEGTRNRDDTSLQAVKGGSAMIAVKADVPIVPVIINKRSKMFRRSYIYIAPPATLPYTSKDRFDSAAMAECTQIITDEMTYAREFMDIAAPSSQKRKERKALKKEEKKVRKAERTGKTRSDM